MKPFFLLPKFRSLILSLALLTTLPFALHAQPTDDPYIWLEEIEAEKSMNWVEAQNDKSLKALTSHNDFEDIYQNNLKLFNSDERIAYPSIRGSHLYNFWKDAEHPKGIWRRCKLESYLKQPVQWEVLLDVDALGKKEGTNWVFKGTIFRQGHEDRCLVQLSRGGADAVEIREFELANKSFVKDGFFLPEGKSQILWKDENSLYVATDFGDGSMSQAGYPLIVKTWKRGTPLNSAETIMEARASDIGMFVAQLKSGKNVHDYLIQVVSSFEYQFHLIGENGLTQIELPMDAFPYLYQDQLIVQLKSDWEIGEQVYPQGALIYINFQAYLDGDRSFSLLLKPEGRSSVEGIRATEEVLLIHMLNNVSSELYEYRLKDGSWVKNQVPTPEFGSLSLNTTSEKGDLYFFSLQSFLQPTTLYLKRKGSEKPEVVRQLPAFFDASPYQVQQFEAKSEDGTQVPYFLISSKDLKPNGKTPTILYGYGGFAVSMTPYYLSGIANNWLSRGGAYVLSNIRGGGEFGPQWHQAAMKENRQRSYDDFIAVAEDLQQRKISSPKHLGIMGGSNGGLLVGAVFTQRPDLFNAVACQVPLLDMQRYHKLLAGASWMGEYGNPDKPEEWEYIKQYSPYHHLSKKESYPKVLFYTSTRDDRVHPGHARKMAAKMLDMGHEVYFYENIEGGHAGGADNTQRAFMSALGMAYMLQQLK